MTPVRSIPPGFDATAIAAIQRQLRRIEAEHHVTIVWAVESGSRAWGFPSPDSDFDCRFIFVRPLADYLSVDSKRDVIDVPVDENLDVVGWDLFKTARLLLKGNATAIEWLTSPIVYRGWDEFRAEWCAEAERLVDRAALLKHYHGLGTSQRRRSWPDPGQVALKKILYVLRPAVALRWLRMHPGSAVAPMHFPTLVAETELPSRARESVEALLARKARTREMGQGEVPPAIAELVEAEFEMAREALDAAGERPPAATDRRGTDELLRRWIRRCDPPPGTVPRGDL